MRTKHLIFFVIVSCLTVFSVFLPEIQVTEKINLSQSELWRYGLAPASILLGMVLLISAIAARRGSIVAFWLCVSWGAIYCIVIGSLILWRFPTEAKQTLIFGGFWAIVWAFSIKKWNKQEIKKSAGVN